MIKLDRSLSYRLHFSSKGPAGIFASNITMTLQNKQTGG
jgi:hypothetical protein